MVFELPFALLDKSFHVFVAGGTFAVAFFCVRTTAAIACKRWFALHFSHDGRDYHSRNDGDCRDDDNYFNRFHVV